MAGLLFWLQLAQSDLGGPHYRNAPSYFHSSRLLRAVANTEHLESQPLRLRELEFVYEKEIVPELLYLFKHYLTQEATYNSILIQRRKEMHRQVAAAIDHIYKDGLDRYYSVLAQHYEKAAEYKRAFECYRLAGDKAQATTSVSAAVQLYERGETALQMLHEDRPGLRNKLKGLAVMAAVPLAYFLRLIWLNAKLHGTQFPPEGFSSYAAGVLTCFIILLGGLALLAFLATQGSKVKWTKPQTLFLPWSRSRSAGSAVLVRFLSLSSRTRRPEKSSSASTFTSAITGMAEGMSRAQRATGSRWPENC
jgi:hypothetical protein